jgi:hypothetical protein
MSSFVCSVCHEPHSGVPLGYRLAFPADRYPVGAVRFERNEELVRAADDRFILANIELPISRGPQERFVWTCWISLSHESYDRMQRLWDRSDRADQESAFGYVSSRLPTYEPSTFALKSRVHTRPVGVRPWVELEPTHHPLAVEQRDGIGDDRIAALYHFYEARASGETRQK